VPVDEFIRDSERTSFQNRSLIKFTTKIDSKGRILLPVEIRKTLGLDDIVELQLSVSGNYVLIRRLNYG